MYPDYSDPPNRSVGRSYYSTLVGFPVSCFVLTFLTDLAYWKTASYLWETISVWLLVLGLIGVGLAMIGGVGDLVRSRRIRGLAQPVVRVLGHLVAFGLSLVNVFVHSRDGYTAVVPQGLILSAVVVLVLLVTTIVSGRTASRAPAGGYA